MKRKISLLAMLFCILFALPASAERILFVPLDDRPVCLAYPTATFQTAGVEVVTPPTALLASRGRNGDPDGLLDWLEKEAPNASSAVVASDSVLYGGLVPSRTHHETAQILQTRLARLNALSQGPLPLRLYVFSTIMRTPRTGSGGTEEPPYYKEWGADLFGLSALTDKKERGLLTEPENSEAMLLQQRIPQAVRQDWSQRRLINEEMNEALIGSLANGNYTYFVLGRDDTAVYSQSRREFRQLSQLTKNISDTQYRSFAGTDEVGWVLLLRAKNDLEQQMPFVKVAYAPGAGAATVASYEDDTVGNSVKNHLLAAGALPVQGKADLLLAVNTPLLGKTIEATDPINQAPRAMDAAWLAFLREAVVSGKPVAMADVSFSNGGDDALVRALAKEGLALSLASYGGWNTASNTIGAALVQGVLAAQQPKREQQRQLAVRFLEDWGYQARVRQELAAALVWPQGWNGNQLTQEQRTQLEAEGTRRLRSLAEQYQLLPDGLNADQVRMTLPWSRMFEAYVTIQ